MNFDLWLESVNYQSLKIDEVKKVLNQWTLEFGNSDIGGFRITRGMKAFYQLLSFDACSVYCLNLEGGFTKVFFRKS